MKYPDYVYPRLNDLLWEFKLGILTSLQKFYRFNLLAILFDYQFIIAVKVFQLVHQLPVSLIATDLVKLLKILSHIDLKIWKTAFFDIELSMNPGSLNIVLSISTVAFLRIKVNRYISIRLLLSTRLSVKLVIMICVKIDWILDDSVVTALADVTVIDRIAGLYLLLVLGPDQSVFWFLAGKSEDPSW